MSSINVQAPVYLCIDDLYMDQEWRQLQLFVVAVLKRDAPVALTTQITELIQTSVEYIWIKLVFARTIDNSLSPTPQMQSGQS